MRTFIYLIITCAVSTGAIVAGLNQHEVIPGYLIGFAAWALFFWGWQRRCKRRAERRAGDKQFIEAMRRQQFRK